MIDPSLATGRSATALALETPRNINRVPFDGTADISLTRIVTVTQSATPALNTDNGDVAVMTGLAQAVTNMSTNLTGTPVGGDTLRYEITDNGTARALAWGSKFEGLALPTSTVLSAKLVCNFVWNTVTSKWLLVRVSGALGSNAAPVDVSSAQAISNKQLEDSTTALYDTADSTKTAKFDVPSGQTTGTARTHTLPATDSTLATLTGTETHTNKRITKRVLTSGAAPAAPTINTDNCDVFGLTAQGTTNITSLTTNLSGTPVDGDQLRIYIVSSGALTIAHGASFEAGAVALVTAISGAGRLDMGYFWNAATSKWRIMASGFA